MKKRKQASRRLQPPKLLKMAEILRRKRISRSLKLWYRTHVTADERRYGKRLAKEQRTETKARKVVGKSTKERILSMAEEARKASGLPSILDFTTHADGSFETEIRVDIKRGEVPSRVMAKLAEQIVFPDQDKEKMWISSGWAFQASADMTPKEIKAYERLGKWLQVHAHYQRPENFVTNILGSRRLAEILKEKGRRKQEQAFIRIFWNPTGKRPE